ncbi:hypothetical protein LOTGIDRAFT_156175 [Lottia gigantea]|uniref:Ig-like domain-containing protein n=1 Tax=Lottia gigantea TaxID=225164 RepID=V4AL63_LOTGI|nr:hypothetical protein LOTGIDRAFT_156175 [Lottia gigantea]ESP04934.1 hypothetical protein LOTGIDRAFT_156175 [Lottia gigantea]
MKLGTILVAVLLVCTNANTQIPKVIGGLRLNKRNASNTEVTLTCALSFLNETVAWNYNGEEKFSCDFPYAAGACTEAENFSGNVDTYKNVVTIRFFAVEERIGGNWTCVSGDNTSTPFVIDAGCKLEIKKNETNFDLKAKEGDKSALMSLVYTGKPVPQFTWYREDEEGVEWPITNYRTKQDAFDSCNLDIPCMSLRIFNPIKADSGNYTIRVNETTSGLMASYRFNFIVTLPEAIVPILPNVVPGCEAVPNFSFGEGIGVGMAIAIFSMFFIAGVVYGCRDS